MKLHRWIGICILAGLVIVDFALIADTENILLVEDIRPRLRQILEPGDELIVKQRDLFRGPSWWGVMELSSCVEVVANGDFFFEECPTDQQSSSLWGGRWFKNPHSSRWGRESLTELRIRARDKTVEMLLFADQDQDERIIRKELDLTLTKETPSRRFVIRPGEAVKVSSKTHRRSAKPQRLSWTTQGGCAHVHSSGRIFRSCPGDSYSLSELLKGQFWIVVHAYEEDAIFEVQVVF